MLVRKNWITRELNTSAHWSMRVIIRYWDGWFLFGLIPLYAHNIKTEYKS